MLEDALVGLAWSLGGFIVGFTLAAFLFMSEAAQVSENTAAERERRTEWLKRLGVILLIVLALLSTIVGYLSAREQRESADAAEAIARCQSRFNHDVSRVIRERSRLATRDRNEMVRMLTRVITQTEDREQLDAIQDFIRGARHRSEQRPDLPESPNCGRR